MVYTLTKRTEIIFLYEAEEWRARRTTRVFNEWHQNKNVGYEYVMELVRKFEETGSACNKKTMVKVLDTACQFEVQE